MTDHPRPAEGLREQPPIGPARPDTAPPVIHGEDAADYDDMLQRTLSFVKPADVLEEAWARDVANLIWEARRLARLKATLIRTATRRVLRNLLRPIIYSDRQPGSDSKDFPNEQELAVGWATGERKAIERVEKLLASLGMSAEAVAAEAMAAQMNEIERIDRMTAIAEQRRVALLREIEAHRLRPAGRVDACGGGSRASGVSGQHERDRDRRDGPAT